MKRSDIIGDRLQTSSILRYKQSNGLWMTFLTQVEADNDPWLDTFSIKQKRSICTDFLIYLLNDHKMTDTQISMAWSSLRNEFLKNQSDINFFDNDPNMKFSRNAVKKRARDINPNCPKARRLPITADMIAWMKSNYWMQTSDILLIDKCMIYIGVVLAFNFMWRASEYILDSKCNKHYISSSNVIFILASGCRINAYTLSSSKTVEKIVTAVFIVQSSKTDQKGLGRYLYLTGQHSQQEAELLNDVVSWCRMAKLRSGDPLLSRWQNDAFGRSRQKKLTREMVGQSLKVMAHANHVDSLGFAVSPHCLRIGGISTMRAAGIPACAIRKTAGISQDSTVDDIYDVHNPHDLGALSVSRSLSDKDVGLDSTCFKLLSIAEVRQLVPHQRADRLVDLL